MSLREEWFKLSLRRIKSATNGEKPLFENERNKIKKNMAIRQKV